MLNTTSTKVMCKPCNKKACVLRDEDDRPHLFYSLCVWCGREFVSKEQILMNDRLVKEFDKSG